MSGGISRSFFLLFLPAVFWSSPALASSYEYIRLGEKADGQAIPIAGTAMMAGVGISMHCAKKLGDDILVLRARSDDDTTHTSTDYAS